MEWSDVEAIMAGWRRILEGQGKSWVVFANGTCVVLAEPQGDLKEQAIELLKVWGPAHAGTPSGDFWVVELENNGGHVVESHHPDIMTYLPPEEDEEGTSEMIMGLIGRSKRDLDAQELKVVHVEDGRKRAG